MDSKLVKFFMAMSVIMGLAVGGLFFFSVYNSASKLEVTPTTAKVTSVSDPINVSYQCGTTKVGEVSIPKYCNRDEYKVSYAVVETDHSMSDQIRSAPSEGDSRVVYSIFNNESETTRYSFSNPQSVGSLVGTGFLAFAAAVAIAILGITLSLKAER